jgi:hypothetical protein
MCDGNFTKIARPYRAVHFRRKKLMADARRRRTKEPSENRSPPLPFPFSSNNVPHVLRICSFYSVCTNKLQIINRMRVLALFATLIATAAAFGEFNSAFPWRSAVNATTTLILKMMCIHQDPLGSFLVSSTQKLYHIYISCKERKSFTHYIVSMRTSHTTLLMS